jgi:radical SAM protein with 4Fe4S-binding SPASM domain
LRDTHDYIRQTRGAFDKGMEGLALLRKMEISTGSITCVSRWNLHELEGIQKELIRRKVLAWQVQIVFPGGRMREHMNQMPRPEDIIPMAQFIIRENKRFKDKKTPINTFSADSLGYCSSICKDLLPGWKGCQAGLRGIGIESDGTIKGCLSLSPEIKGEKDPFAEGNIKEKSLKEIWENRDGFIYNRNFDKRKVHGFCRTCKHLDTCRCGCSQASYFATGNRYENPYCLYRLEELGYNINEPYDAEVLKERCKDAIREAEEAKKRFFEAE